MGLTKWCLNGCGTSVKKNYSVIRPLVYRWCCFRCGQLHVNLNIGGKKVELVKVTQEQVNKWVENNTSKEDIMKEVNRDG